MEKNLNKLHSKKSALRCLSCGSQANFIFIWVSSTRAQCILFWE